MKMICVDDERLLMEEVVEMCESLTEIDEATGFTGAAAAINWMKQSHADIALLDIDMPGMNGIELAIKLKELNPDIAIIFLTGYAEYAVDVIASHIEATGYLLKPVNKEKIAAEIKFAISEMPDERQAGIFARTFDDFDLFVNGEPVSFDRMKAKELLAYLIDRQGAGVSRKRIYSVLWEDEGAYDRQAQKYLDVIIRSLRTTLAEYGADDIMEMEKGILRVRPEKFDCDVYRFFEGDPRAVNSYRGEYMSEYSWASMSEAYLDMMKEGE